MPLCSPEPFSCSSPRTDTWCGLVEQWIAGTHTALAIVTERGCVGGLLLVVGFLEIPPEDLPGGAPVPGGVPPPDGAGAPPEPVDAAENAGWPSAEQARQSVVSTALQSLDVDRLCTDALATNHPLRAPWSPAPAEPPLMSPCSPQRRGRRRSTLAVLALQTAGRQRSCVPISGPRPQALPRRTDFR
jgi:hypothetical protein